MQAEVTGDSYCSVLTNCISNKARLIWYFVSPSPLDPDGGFTAFHWKVHDFRIVLGFTLRYKHLKWACGNVTFWIFSKRNIRICYCTDVLFDYYVHKKLHFPTITFHFKNELISDWMSPISEKKFLIFYRSFQTSINTVIWLVMCPKNLNRCPSTRD